MPENDCVTDLKIKIARLEEKLVGADRALILQAEENKRRLDALNGEAERLRKMQETYVPRETFDSFRRELSAQAQALEKISNQEQGKTIGSHSQLTYIIISGVSLLVSLFAIFHK